MLDLSDMTGYFSMPPFTQIKNDKRVLVFHVRYLEHRALTHPSSAQPPLAQGNDELLSAPVLCEHGLGVQAVADIPCGHMVARGPATQTAVHKCDDLERENAWKHDMTLEGVRGPYNSKWYDERMPSLTACVIAENPLEYTWERDAATPPHPDIPLWYFLNHSNVKPGTFGVMAEATTPLKLIQANVLCDDNFTNGPFRRQYIFIAQRFIRKGEMLSFEYAEPDPAWGEICYNLLEFTAMHKLCIAALAARCALPADLTSPIEEAFTELLDDVDPEKLVEDDARIVRDLCYLEECFQDIPEAFAAEAMLECSESPLYSF
jgi:hypothetical protein